MTSSLREALDAQARGIPALGDIDAALEQVGTTRRRRRAMVAAVSGLAAAAALVWAAGLGSRSTDGAPITPAPSGAPVITLEREPVDLARAPLTDGAEAVVRGGVAGTQAISGTQQRGNVVSSFRLYNFALSPDGHFLAWSGSTAYGSGDQLHITDLTSATEVFTAPIVAATGGGGQTPRMEWSGDSRTLAMVVLETARMEVGPDVGELQLLDVRADGSVETAAAPIDLPGPFVGVDRTATTVLAESSSGTIVTRRAQGGAWTSAGAAASAWPGGLDTQELHAVRWWELGVHRLSPDGERVAWVQRGAEPRTDSMIGWVSLATGEWTTWTVRGADVTCLGWRGAELLLAVRGASATDVVAVDPAGVQRVLVTYAVDELVARTVDQPEILVALDRVQR